AEPDAPVQPRHWEDGPWEFWLKVAPAPGGKRYVITGELRRGEERMALAAPLLVARGGLVFWDDRVAPLHDFGAFDWILLLRRQPEVAVPAGQKDELLQELLRLPSLPRLELPDELRYEE